MTSFSVLSWNTFGVKSYGYFLHFKKAARVIERYAADIVCLQEMNFAKKKLLQLRNFAEYAAVVPYANRHEYTIGVFNHNVVLSKFRIVRRGEVTFPNIFRFLPVERVLYVDLDIRGAMLRIYNCHFAVLRAGVRERFSQLDRVLSHAKSCAWPVIICGDMNTFIRESGLARRFMQFIQKVKQSSLFIEGNYFLADERYEFERRAREEGFTECFNLKTPTWSPFGLGFEMFDLKLDWFLVRGLKVFNSKFGGYVSDHRPLFVECSFEA